MLNTCHNGTGLPTQPLGPSRAERWARATRLGILVTGPWSGTAWGEGTFLTTRAPGSAAGSCAGAGMVFAQFAAGTYLHDFLHYSKVTHPNHG